ncbi:helix-hairpin-helix domain-containing protein [uncultured Lactobacillus sp.]|uniref:helix-hairpin-helix domain-containing protein n=1 Tax=uncultured Lactobacillus sp. TaxID=153152 RepID=UPI002587A2F2|nr:helix-hairpin-helix domain-containing protein [uncultured Lactobacillus sp.]
MNFEKIKEFTIEKKVYLIAAGIILIGFFYFKKGDSQDKNTEAENTQLMQKSRSSSSTTMENTASSSSVSESKTVTCDISGAVKHEGVYTLKNGARLQELIEAAGGTTSRAQLKAINRAVLLKDQDKIHIPYKGEKVENAATIGTGTGSPASSTSSESGSSEQGSGEKINLNTANVADLQKLTGIGEKKAEQIIAYREQKGSFKKIEDLMQVSGIGEKTFASLKDQLAV